LSTSKMARSGVGNRGYGRAIAYKFYYLSNTFCARWW
jgi:hypothetical protein